MPHDEVTDDMKHGMLIVAVSACAMLTGLGSSRLWDDDEPRNAGCAREMLARWDWIVPTFNAELRAHKPVLTYWCIMVSYLVLGESEFSARLPSAVAAIGTTLLTYAIGRRLFSREAALWAALILPTTLLFAMAGRIATPDSLLIFCVTLTMAVYVWTAWPSEHAGDRNLRFFPRPWWRAALIYAAMGLAVLAKGPVGLVLPTAILGTFLLNVRWGAARDGRSWWAGARQGEAGPAYRLLVSAVCHFFHTAWSMRPLTALAVVALIAGPWYLAVGYQTDWQFLEEFFVTHNLQRATGAMEGHSGGIWFYPVALLIGFFPWSIFAIPLVLDMTTGMKRPSRERTAQIFLLCWIGVWLGTFTLARTKLPSYATPCFPAVALLLGHFLHRLLAGETATGRYWPAVSFTCLTAVGALLTTALPFVVRRYLPGEEWLAIVGLPPLAGGIAAVVLWSRGRLRSAIGGLVASAATLVVAVFGLSAHAASRHQTADRLLAVAYASCESSELASFKVLEPSWVYYGRRPIREFHGPPEEAADFLAARPDRLLITTEKHWKALARAASEDAGLVVLASEDYFLKNERLLLIGPSSARLARRGADPSPGN